MDSARPQTGMIDRRLIRPMQNPSATARQIGKRTDRTGEHVKLTGSCACGSVQFECGSLTGPIAWCQCPTCQNVHGATCVTTARANRSSVRWTKGPELLRGYESSPGKHRHFCSVCGTHLMAEWSHHDTVILRIGSVDGGADETPTVHIGTGHDYSWLSDHGVPRVPEGAAANPQ